jgi:hypothetical protein
MHVLRAIIMTPLAGIKLRRDRLLRAMRRGRDPGDRLLWSQTQRRPHPNRANCNLPQSSASQ